MPRTKSQVGGRKDVEASGPRPASHQGPAQRPSVYRTIIIKDGVIVGGYRRRRRGSAS